MDDARGDVAICATIDVMDFDGDAPHWPITSDTELHALWCRLMGEGGFSRHSLWLLFLDAKSVTLPIIMPNNEIGPRPTEQWVPLLFRIWEEVHRQGAESFAALLSRPGPARKTDDDRAWAAALTRGARARGVPMWPVHLATYGRVQPMAADDLIGVGEASV